jgi:hypothetical protein
LKQFVKDWVLPPKVFELIKKEVSLFQLKKSNLSVIQGNQRLKNKFQGQRCFILGNAPTIQNIDISLLKDEYVFVMSTFYNHPAYSSLNKSIFSSVHLTGSKIYEENLKWMKAINDNTKSTQIFFFDLAQKKMIEENNLFINKEVHYIATANTARSYDISKPTRGYETNVVQALEIAIYLGFKEIYLHSVNLNTVCESGMYNYFFDRNLMPYKDEHVDDNSFCKDFFATIQSLYVATKAIFEVKIHADSAGVDIYYTNQESLLKFFKFIEFNNVIGACIK